MSDVSLEQIVSLCKRRGFIFQGSEVYGGLAGTWDYGPLGLSLKRNIMNLWWQTFVEERDDMYGVDAAILMNQKVWQASGHASGFNDPLVSCKKCGSRFRLDKILSGEDLQSYKEFLGKLEEAHSDPEYLEHQPEPFKTIEGIAQIAKHRDDAANYVGSIPQKWLNGVRNIKCPVCGNKDWDEPRLFNMMFKTNVGPVDDENSVSYLRPETAQGIFTNYKNVVDSFYPDVPFGIAQQGKAFRNEISPRDFVFRSREFEQMEIEYFVHENEWETAFDRWVSDIEQFLKALGLPEESVHKLEVPEDDRAHYSKRTIDFEFDYPHGRDELLGLAYRTDFDLQNIQKASGKSMEYQPKDGGEPFVPHVIEPSFGVERTIMAVLTSAYTEDEVNGEKRSYLKLPIELAPVKVAVCPLAKNKPELVAKAQEVYKLLKKEFGAVMWIDSGNIGKNYRRMDEIGTPYCVTIDFDTLEDDTVTVRNRDTTEQERVKVADLTRTLGDE
jgi:glycyl-tRNA synthetase